jgi:Uma2 family endonuclease
MTISSNQLKTQIVYPISDGKPMAESDPARDYLIYCVEALDIYFQNRRDVYVSGNLLIYYKEKVPSAVVAPDVFVVFGVSKKKRLIYKVWEEDNKTPSFVLEVTSATTQENDEQEKPIKYASLGVSEYFQYDPTGDYLNPQLKGFKLVEGQYQPIASSTQPNGEIFIYSQVLNLDLRLVYGELRFFEPGTENKLLSHKETEQARKQAEQARIQAEQARQQAIPRLLEMGLSVEQVANALGFAVEEIREFLND